MSGRHMTRADWVTRAVQWGVNTEGKTKAEIAVAVDRAIAFDRELRFAAPAAGYSLDGWNPPEPKTFRYKGRTFRATYYHDGCIVGVREVGGD